MKVSTRRSFFRYMAVLGLVVWGTTPLQAKIAQDKIEYQDTPKDGKKCIDCIHYFPDTKECKLVEGLIDPNGWCKLYYKFVPKKIVKAYLT